MTLEELQALFDKHGDEFLNFNLVEQPRHRRRDVAAFILLDELSPPNEGKHSPMVSWATHDEITLDAAPNEVAANATEAQVVELIRCGVRYSADNDCFEMFT